MNNPDLMKKILLDTNLLLYSMDANSKFYEISTNILENEAYDLFVSTKNIAELLAVNSKLKIDKSITLSFINEILDISTLLYPTKHSFDIFLQIISNYSIKGNKVYDMEIVSIMLANKLDTIATFNHKDFREISEIQILNECIDGI